MPVSITVLGINAINYMYAPHDRKKDSAVCLNNDMLSVIMISVAWLSVVAPKCLPYVVLWQKIPRLEFTLICVRIFKILATGLCCKTLD